MDITELKQPVIGDLIKALRLEMNMSQEKFANLLGISFVSLNRWENHKTMPSSLALQMINSYLDKLDDKGSKLIKNKLLAQ